MKQIRFLITVMLTALACITLSGCDKDGSDMPDDPSQENTENPSQGNTNSSDIAVSDELVSFDKTGKGADGNTFQSVVVSNVNADFTVSCESDWITSTASGNTVIVTVDANKSGVGRRGVIIINDSNKTKEIIVEQNAYIVGERVKVNNQYAQVFDINGCIAKVCYSLDETEYKWCTVDVTSLIDISEFSDTDGEINTAIAKRIDPALTKFPAFKACDMMGNGVWYLPAKDELEKIFKMWGAMGRNLWSSTPTGSSSYVYALYGNGESFSWNYCSPTSQTNEVYPVRKFSTLPGTSNPSENTTAQLSVDKNYLSFDRNGNNVYGYSTETITIGGLGYFSTKASDRWISTTKNIDKVYISVKSNTTGKGREGYVDIISFDGQQTLRITIEQNAYAIGDVVAIDNVSSRVFQVYGCEARVFITTSEQCYWGMKGDFGKFSETDGEYNKDIVKRIDPGLSEFPAFRACEMAVNNNWYLPAKDELGYIFRLVGKSSHYVWSSTTVDGQSNYAYALKYDGTWDDRGSRLGQKCIVYPARKIYTKNL